jgi:hypothetical protein
LREKIVPSNLARATVMVTVSARMDTAFARVIIKEKIVLNRFV